MTEPVVLLTKCGCSRIVEVLRQDHRVLVPLRPNLPLMAYENAPPPSYIETRQFQFAGRTLRDMRVFEEQ